MFAEEVQLVNGTCTTEVLAMPIFARSSPESKFWDWFAKNEGRFRSIDPSEEEELLDLFESHLHKYDAELTFEISGLMEDGTNELIISAEGFCSHFPKVEALVSASPAFPNWKIMAFKPAQGFDFTYEADDLTLDPGQLWFLPLRSKSTPEVLGLRVGVPGLDEHDVACVENAVWIILDTGLGEKVCAERIKHLEVVTLPEHAKDGGYIGLPEISEYLAWRDCKNSKQ
jgi:hypothetical protein